MIPINVPNIHFFTICVFMKKKRIQVIDSLPDSLGRKPYLDKVFMYLQQEHLLIRKCPLDVDSWTCFIANPRDDDVPRQGNCTNDCGIFTCLFMDFLLLNLPLAPLTQIRIGSYGRQWLCRCILTQSIVF